MHKSLKDHIIFWVVLLASFSVIPFFQEGNSASLGALILQNIKRLPAMCMAAYIFNEWLLPVYCRAQRYVFFTLLSLGLFYVAAVLDRVVNVYIYEPLFREPPFEQESLIQIMSDVPFLISAYMPPLLIATFAMTFKNIVHEKQVIEHRNAALERDKNLAELNALKSQLHPHFLFNTLNNLYALTVQKSDKAPEMVATLSRMLDYILYQCNDRLVPLDKEVELLEDYIALEQLRYGDEIDICTAFDLPPRSRSGCEPCLPVGRSRELAFERAEIKIAPLLLLSIVENAFKHGASGSLDKPEIHITLAQKETELFFDVRNTRTEKSPTDRTGFSKGIGVKNVRKQLDLLYPDYSYKVTDEKGWYRVTLRINTARAYG